MIWLSAEMYGKSKKKKKVWATVILFHESRAFKQKHAMVSSTQLFFGFFLEQKPTTVVIIPRQ